MTAIVGVMNKQAVAIAADSAITMGNTHKVINTGNKIFTLSKFEPVGIAIYSNASLMGVPWEIIIKTYRNKIKDLHLPHLRDYVSNFFEYLHDNHFFSGNDTQSLYFQAQINSFLNLILRNININSVKLDKLDDQEKKHILKQELIKCLTANKISPEICEDYKLYDFEQFKNEEGVLIDQVLKSQNFINFTSELIDLFKEAFFYYWKLKIIPQDYTGLVFFGYGDSELYPSIISCITSVGINGKLKYFIKEEDSNTICEGGCSVAISPFAQIDVIQTIIRGMTPDCEKIIMQNIKNGVDSYKDILIDFLSKQPEGQTIANALKNIDNSKIIEKLNEGVRNSIRNHYTDPLLQTVASLSKEDLANMAESFISLTCLIRRMSPHEETVGGPIDVAVVSKGDGFIWMNRKHYFSPELNNHFFKNYYKFHENG